MKSDLYLEFVCRKEEGSLIFISWDLEAMEFMYVYSKSLKELYHISDTEDERTNEQKSQLNIFGGGLLLPYTQGNLFGN